MIELVHYTKMGGPLTKRIFLNEDGKLISDGSACTMSTGVARRARFSDLSSAAAFISDMPATDALSLGRLRGNLGTELHVTTQTRLAGLNGKATPDLIARTADFIAYQAGQPALALIDVDVKGMPDAIKARISAEGGYWPALCSVLPALATTARIVRNSTSSGLSRTDTGEDMPGSNGQHIYLHIADGADAERFLYTLHDRCWLAGLGWHMVGAGGQLLDRSLVDRMVHAAERLVFEGSPVVEAPLHQDKATRDAVAYDGDVLDTREACPPLRIVETADLKQMKAKSADALTPDRAAERERFIVKQSKALAERTSVSLSIARQAIIRQCEGVLHPGIVLPFDDPALANVTVADVLATSAAYVGETLADPLEGIQYGKTKAMVMRRADGTPWIHSFAHGRTIYELKLDAAAARAAIDAADDARVTDVFVDVAVGGDLDPAELEDLRNVASARSGIGKRTLMEKLKGAQKAKKARDAEEAKNRRAAMRKDTRPQLDAPDNEAEWLPVMGALNDVLSSSKAQEPPMRDIDGVVTQVRVRRVPDLHSLTAQSSNDGDTKDTRLPAPEQPLLTRLDEAQLSELIERHIEYVTKDGIPVHLNSGFVKHYLQRSDTALPVVTGVSTLPLVGLDGNLRAKNGLDRDLGLLFRVAPEILKYTDNLGTITDERIRAAYDFLVNDWLFDVLTDDTGKAVLVTAALTIIERAFLPERPAFFVTAGRRGGGKTTALGMVMAAATGVRPCAAAWSTNDEERRKGLLAYLMEGLPALIYDNIPRGAQLSCPHIEKALTSATYSDRVLGVSQTVTVSSSTILTFTGNNIAPKGDLASRSLQARIEVDRADPENRQFKHPDPIAWTEANRGKILRALYLILLGNPHRAEAGETRFKGWWRLVGSAVEHAASLNGHDLHFRDVFMTQEVDDEEGAALVDALSALHAKFQDRAFSASELVKFLNDTWEARPEWEKQGAIVVREFLFPTLPHAQPVSPMAAGKRLKARVGEPVMAGERTLTLKAGQDPHAKMATFYVAVRV
ncbi:MAG: hypothetical protein HIU92_02605 [Proteobacteria bacterium]|nr:hypothetical protein [Pseudomonadota bacterium]